MNRRVVTVSALGTSAQTLGNPDALHTYTFIDDFAASFITLADRDEALGEVW